MRLGIYLNPALKLRLNANRGEPDPALLAAMSEMAGAELILAGWNPDGGLVTERDIRRIREATQADLLLIVPALAGIADKIAQLSPNGVILVESNWDGVRPAQPLPAAVQPEQLSSTAAAYNSAGVPVSALLEPELQNVKAAARANLTGVVLDCLKFSQSATDEEAENALSELENASIAAGKFGLVSAYLNGLNYRNIGYLAALPSASEFYVGDALIQRALLVGLDVAVRDLCQMIFHHNR